MFIKNLKDVHTRSCFSLVGVFCMLLVLSTGITTFAQTFIELSQSVRPDFPKWETRLALEKIRSSQISLSGEVQYRRANLSVAINSNNRVVRSHWVRGYLQANYRLFPLGKKDFFTIGMGPGIAIRYFEGQAGIKAFAPTISIKATIEILPSWSLILYSQRGYFFLFDSPGFKSGWSIYQYHLGIRKKLITHK